VCSSPQHGSRRACSFVLRVIGAVVGIGMVCLLTGQPRWPSDPSLGTNAVAETAVAPISPVEIVGTWQWWCCGDRHGSVTFIMTQDGRIEGRMDQDGQAAITLIHGIRVFDDTVAFSRTIGTGCVQQWTGIVSRGSGGRGGNGGAGGAGGAGGNGGAGGAGGNGGNGGNGGAGGQGGAGGAGGQGGAGGIGGTPGSPGQPGMSGAPGRPGLIWSGRVSGCGIAGSGGMFRAWKP